MKCNTKLGPWQSSDVRIPLDSVEPHGRECSCECGQTNAITHTSTPIWQGLMMRIKGEESGWSVIISQRDCSKGWYSYRFRASPVIIGGSNIQNTFIWNFNNLKWQLKLPDYPDFIYTIRDNNKFIAKLDLLLSFS